MHETATEVLLESAVRLRGLIISRCGPECLHHIPGSYCIYLAGKVSTSHVFAHPSTSRASLCHVGVDAVDQIRATDPNGPMRPYPPPVNYKSAQSSGVHHACASSASHLPKEVRTKPFCITSGTSSAIGSVGASVFFRSGTKPTSTPSWPPRRPLFGGYLSCCFLTYPRAPLALRRSDQLACVVRDSTPVRSTGPGLKALHAQVCATRIACPGYRSLAPCSS